MKIYPGRIDFIKMIFAVDGIAQEEDETFSLSISGMENYELFSQNAIIVTGTIIDSDSKSNSILFWHGVARGSLLKGGCFCCTQRGISHMCCCHICN